MSSPCVFFIPVAISMMKILDKHGKDLSGWLPLSLSNLNLQVPFEKLILDRQ